jgi:hypothetical protein
VDAPRPKLEIEWLYDDHDCEVCGPSYAEGAIVRMDNVVILELIPNAHCYSSESYEAEEVFVTLLEHFGFDVSIRETHVTLPPIQEEDDDEEDV